MKVYTASEKEISEKFENQGFCKVFQTLESAPEGFYELQNEIGDGLEKEFWANFAEGYEAPRYKWANPTNKWFYFNGDMFGSEQIVVEMSKEILGDKLIGLILSYLEKNASSYCVTLSVYESMEGKSDYIGAFIINMDEIAIEESLADVWSKQIQFIEIEERK